MAPPPHDTAAVRAAKALLSQRGKEILSRRPPFPNEEPDQNQDTEASCEEQKSYVVPLDPDEIVEATATKRSTSRDAFRRSVVIVCSGLLMGVSAIVFLALDSGSVGDITSSALLSSKSTPHHSTEPKAGQFRSALPLPADSKPVLMSSQKAEVIARAHNSLKAKHQASKNEKQSIENEKKSVHNEAMSRAGAALFARAVRSAEKAFAPQSLSFMPPMAYKPTSRRIQHIRPPQLKYSAQSEQQNTVASKADNSVQPQLFASPQYAPPAQQYPQYYSVPPRNQETLRTGGNMNYAAAPQNFYPTQAQSQQSSWPQNPQSGFYPQQLAQPAAQAAQPPFAAHQYEASPQANIPRQYYDNGAQAPEPQVSQAQPPVMEPPQQLSGYQYPPASEQPMDAPIQQQQQLVGQAGQSPVYEGIIPQDQVQMAPQRQMPAQMPQQQPVQVLSQYPQQVTVRQQYQQAPAAPLGQPQAGPGGLLASPMPGQQLSSAAMAVPQAALPQLPTGSDVADENQPMLVDGSAADTQSLQAQAQATASKTLGASLGSDSPILSSFRQRLQQEMLQKEQQRTAGISMLPTAPSGLEPAAAEEDGREVEGEGGEEGPSVVRESANPYITRMAFMAE